MPGPLDPIAASDGTPVYTALVKPVPGGALLLFVLLDDDETDPNRRVWTSVTFSGPEAEALAIRLSLESATPR